MVFFKAQRLQELARLLLQLQRRLEAGGGEATHIREELEDVAQRVGVDLAIVRLASPDTVVEVLTPGGGGDPGKIWAVGEVLFLDGLRAAAEGDAQGTREALERAQRLFQALPKGVRLPPEAATPRERLQRIGKLLGQDG